MTRLERCEYLKSIGYVYDSEIGEVFKYGKKMGSIDKRVRRKILTFKINKKIFKLSTHHFAWYSIYGNVNFEQLDHIDRNQSNNKISNLRVVTNQQNQMNKNSRGYYFMKKRKKYRVYIHVDGKNFHGGYFENEEDARKRYLELKEIYHKID